MIRSSARIRRRTPLFPLPDTARDSRVGGRHGQGRNACLLAAALIVTIPSPARAHERAVTVSSVDIADSGTAPITIVWKVDVAIDDLARLPGLAGLPARLDEAALRAHADAIGRALAPGARVIPDGGGALPPRVGAIEPRFASGTRRIAAVVQTLAFTAPVPFARATLSSRFLAPAGPGHRALITVTWSGQSRRYARTEPAEIAIARGQLFASWVATFAEFFRWGVGHILIGWDHLAFLFCLILAARRPRDLLLTVTAFTAGHSLTLLAAGFGVLRVSPRLAEIGIALTVIYVALENIARGERPARGRWWQAAAFGLVHGLGLASELAARLDEAGPRLAAAVLAFNVGVELGQIVVGALLFAVVVWLRRWRPLVRIASLPVLVLGVYWLIARTIGN
jgi:hydrogenase/urease accessory protein HupE